MGCCGEKRRRFYGRAPAGAGARGAEGGVAPPGRRLRFSVQFRYVGATAMTVEGPASGRRYRFDRPGATLEVDLRDRLGLARVPGLQEVRY